MIVRLTKSPNDAKNERSLVCPKNPAKLEATRSPAWPCLACLACSACVACVTPRIAPGKGGTGRARNAPSGSNPTTPEKGTSFPPGFLLPRLQPSLGRVLGTDLHLVALARPLFFPGLCLQLCVTLLHGSHPHHRHHTLKAPAPAPAPAPCWLRILARCSFERARTVPTEGAETAAAAAAHGCNLQHSNRASSLVAGKAGLLVGSLAGQRMKCGRNETRQRDGKTEPDRATLRPRLKSGNFSCRHRRQLAIVL